MTGYDFKEGLLVELLTPYKGYRNARLVEEVGHKWLIYICGSGLELEVYPDEVEPLDTCY